MTFDIEKIAEHKRAERRRLASRPIAEKLRMLDALREREIALRSTHPRAGRAGLDEALSSPEQAG